MVDKGDISRRQALGRGVQAASAVLLGASGLQAQEARPARKDKKGAASRPSEQTAGPVVPVKDDLRCGVIGLGGRGSGLLEAVNKSPGVRVTALCDIDEGRLKSAADSVEADHPRTFKNYRELVDLKDLDAVVVATPVYLHAEMAVAVLKSGRHCYSEKPMAMTVRDLNEILDLAKRSKGIYQVGTQLRYGRWVRAAMDLIHDGEVGKPILIRAHRHNAGDLPHGSPWYFQRKLCGDTILEQAVHEFDLFNWVFGGPPVRAAGFGGQALRFTPEPRDIMDHYTLSLDYGLNKKVGYSHSWISAPKIPQDGRQEVVYCEKAAVDIESGTVYPRDFGDPYKVDTDRPADPTQSAINDFFACIRGGRQPLANAETGRNAALTALLGRTAIYEGRVVTMEELLKQG